MPVYVTYCYTRLRSQHALFSPPLTARYLRVNTDGRDVFRLIDRTKNQRVAWPEFEKYFLSDAQIAQHEQRTQTRTEKYDEAERRKHEEAERARAEEEEERRASEEEQQRLAAEAKEAARATALEKQIGTACGRSAKANAKRRALFDKIDTNRTWLFTSSPNPQRPAAPPSSQIESSIVESQAYSWPQLPVLTDVAAHTRTQFIRSPHHPLPTPLPAHDAQQVTESSQFLSCAVPCSAIWPSQASSVSLSVSAPRTQKHAAFCEACLRQPMPAPCTSTMASGASHDTCSWNVSRRERKGC